MPLYAIFLITAFLSFLGTVFLCRRLIPFLREKKMGQKILEIGPRWHKNKEGTPTMGGICFLIPILLFSVLAGILLLPSTPKKEFLPFCLTLLYALLNAVVGLVDDLTKFRHGTNQGLTPRQKLLLQTVFAGAYLALLSLFGEVSTDLRIPFTQHTLSLGVWYYILALFLLVGIVNCANLTDGIDGLAASEAAILASFFAIVAAVRLSGTATVTSAAVFGGALGFLVFNYYPARIFMGDTGSLFLGAILSGCAFLLGEPLLIITAGFLYVLEGISVILQVLVFKLTNGKRLFLMAPVHHHFEKRGWNEVRIVGAFSLLTLVFCAVAVCSVL